MVATAATVIYVHNYVQAAKQGGSKAALRPDRLAGGVTCYVAEIVGGCCPDPRLCGWSICRSGRIDHLFGPLDFWSLVAAGGRRSSGQIAPVLR